MLLAFSLISCTLSLKAAQNLDNPLPIRVNNPKRLPWQLPADRIAIGPGYKPSLALLPHGELVMVALFQEQHEIMHWNLPLQR
jgi:hypothetical protein